MDLVEMFFNRYVVTYLLAVVGIQAAYGLWRDYRWRQIARRRRAQGLPNKVLLNHAERLVERRRDALLQSGLLLGSVLLLPPLLIAIAGAPTTTATPEQTGLAVVFVTLQTPNDDQISIPPNKPMQIFIQQNLIRFSSRLKPMSPRPMTSRCSSAT